MGRPGAVDVAHYASEWPWLPVAAEALRPRPGRRGGGGVSRRGTDPGRRRAAARPRLSDRGGRGRWECSAATVPPARPREPPTEEPARPNPPRPPSPQHPPGWLRRLLGYCLRHRVDLFGAFGAALVGRSPRPSSRCSSGRVIDRVVADSAGVRVSVTWFVIALVGGRRAAVRRGVRPPATSPAGCPWTCSTTCATTSHAALPGSTAPGRTGWRPARWSAGRSATSPWCRACWPSCPTCRATCCCSSSPSA